ncbi:hypothetical protein DPEC_G00109510 [Dallia pectoralis]|uniref:Uncharacterized protein n=1 Tax=Dallia pectoralis TaxID=75939 RepID=A0ACC2GSE3_DALPE|nr:hypothetical protein DPEC_G00109510 [Dallia pectoralis]
MNAAQVTCELLNKEGKTETQQTGVHARQSPKVPTLTPKTSMPGYQRRLSGLPCPTPGEVIRGRFLATKNPGVGGRKSLKRWKLKEENAAHQLQIRRLRDTIMSGKQSSAEESLEQVMKSPMLQSLPLTEVTPALVKQAQDMESVDTNVHELMEDDKKAM